MTTAEMIAAKLAMPMTHKVVAKLADGTVHTHPTRSEGAAKNYADHMRFCGATAIEVVTL